MTTYTQRYTNFSVGADDVYAAVPEIVAPFGKRVVIIGGETALSKTLPTLLPVLEASDLEVVDSIVYGKECTFANGERIANMSAVQNADVIFAVGGGKAIDTVKIVTSHTKQPFFTFPTIASTCAAYTEVAAVYDENHVFAAAFYNGAAAVHTFLNTRILVEAPAKYIWAGMGDTVAKYYESNFSKRGLEVPYNVTAGAMYSGMCVEPLLKYGKEAYESAKTHTLSEAFTQVALSVIVGTGLAAVMLPEDFNSNAAHAVCYGLTTFPEVEEKALHGEMVAYGVLVLLMMDQQEEELQKMLTLYRDIELPMKLAHFGISLEQTEGLLEKAVSTRDTKVSPYLVTKEKLYAAMQALEAL